MFKRNGQPFTLTNGMLIDDVQIILPLSADRMAELGITEETDPQRPDDTYHIVNDDFTTTRKPIAHLVQIKTTQINAKCDELLGMIKKPYPASEVESWPKQENEARAYADNVAAATPLLDALCAARNVTKADLTARIIAKADAFAVAVGTVVGVRQYHEDVIAQLEAAHTAATTASSKNKKWDDLLAYDTSTGWPNFG